MMLELNARPGLNIQIANREGALGRYQRIEAEHAQYPDRAHQDKVAFSRAHFS